MTRKLVPVGTRRRVDVHWEAFVHLVTSKPRLLRVVVATTPSSLREAVILTLLVPAGLRLCAFSGIYVDQGSVRLALVGTRLQGNVSPGAAQVAMRSSGTLAVHNSSLALGVPGVQVSWLQGLIHVCRRMNIAPSATVICWLAFGNAIVTV